MTRAALQSFSSRRLFRLDALFLFLSIFTFGTVSTTAQTPHSSQDSSSMVPGTNFPKLMHICIGGCNAGNGVTFVWQNGRYVNATDPGDKAALTIEKLTKDSV